MRFDKKLKTEFEREKMEPNVDRKGRRLTDLEGKKKGVKTNGTMFSKKKENE